MRPFAQEIREGSCSGTLIPEVYVILVNYHFQRNDVRCLRQRGKRQL